MGVNTMDKPSFNVDQVVPASLASKRFGELRKNAKLQPQFISDNNKIESVVLNYALYEEMYVELEALRELTWEMDLINRLKNTDTTNERYSLQEVMSEDEYKTFTKIDPDSISDEDLFE